MNNEGIGALLLFALFFGISVIASLTLTIDDMHIELDVVDHMTKQCDNNGGLKYIEHDYDVVCNNGASFDYDRSSKYKIIIEDKKE